MIYLDNAATSFPKPEAVWRAMDQFARRAAANPGRSSHRWAAEAEDTIERARALQARLLNAPDPACIAFTLNGTDALNIGIKGLVKHGDHVVTTTFEHNSVVRPLARLERDGVISVTRVGPGEDLTPDPQAIRAACTDRTCLVVVTGCSNVFGALADVAALARAAHDAGAAILVDAAQAVGVADLDVKAAELDMVAFPGHKGLFGPMGTGALYVHPRLKLRPWREGGTGSQPEQELHPTTMPRALEGGTPNAHGLAGLAEGVAFVLEHTPAKIRQHERALARAFIEALHGVPGVRVLTGHHEATATGLVTLACEGVSPDQVAALLDKRHQIAVRAGLHCAPGAHRWLGTYPAGAVRFSFGFFNTLAQAEAAARALAEVTRTLRT